MKNQVIVLPNGEDIVDIVAGHPEPKSDINLFRERQKGFDHRQKFNGDKADEGESSIKTPKKKPKKGELSLSQKEKNKELASELIFVEHLIRVIKIFRVASERFRLNPRKYEQIMMTICGVVRLRIGTLVLPI
ncbi:MAG: transposase family protein [Nostoc sp.]|uniref:transposase family protein n=1 Tax=Nostoc sp. TaxID=1180 RepID=UPI002FF860FE